MKEEIYVKQLKKDMLHEFTIQDRKGVYAYTQKNMAYNSNKIEGSTLTSDQTASLFDTGTLYSSSDLVYRAKDIEEMTGHFKMFNEIMKNLNKPLNINIVKAFHYQLKAGVFEDYANGYPVGEFKSRVNQVSDIVTVTPDQVEIELSKLIDWYNSSPKTLTEIAMFHAQYEHIHPFQDGNGRTGRAITLKQCLDQNIIPVIIKDDNKMKYYYALNEAQKLEKYEKLIEFFKEQQSMYYDATKDYVRFSLRAEKEENMER